MTPRTKPSTSPRGQGQGQGLTSLNTWSANNLGTRVFRFPHLTQVFDHVEYTSNMAACMAMTSLHCEYWADTAKAVPLSELVGSRCTTPYTTFQAQEALTLTSSQTWRLESAPNLMSAGGSVPDPALRELTTLPQTPYSRESKNIYARLLIAAGELRCRTQHWAGTVNDTRWL